MASTRLESASYLATVISAAATVIASGAAVLTFYYGYQQFLETQQASRETLRLQRETLEQERDSQAVELLVKYNELMKEPPSNLESGVGAAEFWRDNLALSIAESIYKLRRDEKGWEKTVKWMLLHHTDFIKNQRLNCDTFDDNFIEFVKQLVGQEICISQ